MADKLEELRVYQEAMAFWQAVNAILDRPAYRKDRKLADQTSDANDSIPANISEGFEQPTDAAFANYLFHAKASLGEVLVRLREARLKEYITDEELSQRLDEGARLSRSLAAFIRYLDSCRWNDRGRHRSRQRQQHPSTKDPGTKDQGTKDQGTKDQGTKDDEGTKDPGTKDQGPRDPGTV